MENDFFKCVGTLYGGSLLTCQLYEVVGGAFGLHVHVLQFRCLKNRKKLQCAGRRRSYSVGNTTLA